MITIIISYVIIALFLVTAWWLWHISKG